MDLGAQRQEVSAWLESLFEPGQVPEYELNAKTINHLYELAQTSTTNDRYAQLIVEDLQQKTDEYYADAQRLSAVLSRMQLSQDFMSSLGINCVKTLAKLGVLLNVKDVSETCYYLALLGLDDEIERIEKERESEAKKLTMLLEKSQPAVQKCKSLHKALEMVKKSHTRERHEAEKRTENSAFLHSKAKSYAKEITKLQEQLSQTQVDESIYHETLVKKAEHLQVLQEKLSPLMAELQSYSNLPPDIAETKIKIEQQKRELVSSGSLPYVSLAAMLAQKNGVKKKLEKELSECIALECDATRTGIS